MLKIDFLINDFLLDHLPDADSRHKQDVINTYRQLLAKIVLLSGSRDRLVDSQMCFSWILVYAGIPSAGILAVELLKQSKQPNEYPFILPRPKSSKISVSTSVVLTTFGQQRETIKFVNEYERYSNVCSIKL